MSIISPTFHRLKEESAVIGRMVLGYSDLELMLAICTSEAIDADRHDILRAIFRTRSESSRLSLADALLKKPLEKIRLSSKFADIKGAFKYCLTLRNQYSHCQWADVDGHLFWANLDAAASKHEGFEFEYKHTDLTLLRAQEEYFAHTREMLFYLEHEIKVRKGAQRANTWQWPAAMSPPAEYNPLVKYPH